MCSFIVRISSLDTISIIDIVSIGLSEFMLIITELYGFNFTLFI